jgi:hypothetical protein
MTARLLRAVVRAVPGFQFNSLRRWLSSPGQFEQLMDDGAFSEPATNEPGTVAPIGFGEP